MRDPFSIFEPDWDNAWFRGTPGTEQEGLYLKTTNGVHGEWVPERPSGVPIYAQPREGARWTAIPSTVFPWGWFWILTVALAVWICVITARPEGSHAPAVLLGIAFYLVSMGLAWYSEVDPVMGAKVSAAILVASAARAQQNRHTAAAARADQERYNGWAAGEADWNGRPIARAPAQRAADQPAPVTGWNPCTSCGGTRQCRPCGGTGSGQWSRCSRCHGDGHCTECSSGRASAAL